MDSIAILVLAAGLGKRMGSELPKVLAKIRSKTLIERVLSTAFELNPEKIVVVVGHGKEHVQKAIGNIKNLEFANQEKQLGTGDAVKSALVNLKGFSGEIIILNGDVPLLKIETLRLLLAFHKKNKATLSLLTLKTKIPNDYGRIVRDKSGKFIERIVELKDCGPTEKDIDEFNSGVYVVDSGFLEPSINSLKNDNTQKEYYLTDIVERAAKEGQTVVGFVSNDPDEVQGVNTRSQLLHIKRILSMKKILALVESGVEIEDSSSVYIDDEANIEPSVKIGPGVQIRGKTKIGKNVVIEGSAYIKDSEIHEAAYIKFGVRMEGAVIGKNSQVGPFANLRSGTVLKEEVKVGNFVETKKAVLEKGAKASHLSYLGDCHIGSESNIGAGTITCNYDGVKKHHTEIGKNVFIGSNSSLIAPVTIEDDASVGAGSVITKTVEKGSLALTRAPLVSKPGWKKKKS